ncbi:hypothetical protein ACFPRA_23925 [Sporosarcina soli]|uniref:Uncharacterized protein n=1 Tax=Sporosarcina soli TaxID=334736 RepID=A0ABW0TU86_9BACL
MKRRVPKGMCSTFKMLRQRVFLAWLISWHEDAEDFTWMDIAGYDGMVIGKL